LLLKSFLVNFWQLNTFRTKMKLMDILL